MWVKCILVFFIISNIFLLGGCDNKKTVTKQAPKTKTENQKDYYVFENFIKNYYNSEITKDENYLKQFFINSNIADIQSVKRKFLIFNIEKIKFTGVYNIKKSGRIAIMVGTFNALFKDISNPRPDVEIIVLVNKNNTWYFLNDDSILNSEETQWVNQQRQSESKFIMTNKEIQLVLQTNKKFDYDNKSYMESCQQKFLEEQASK